MAGPAQTTARFPPPSPLIIPFLYFPPKTVVPFGVDNRCQSCGPNHIDPRVSGLFTPPLPPMTTTNVHICTPRYTLNYPFSTAYILCPRHRRRHASYNSQPPSPPGTSQPLDSIFDLRVTLDTTSSPAKVDNAIRKFRRMAKLRRGGGDLPY